ncbi:hypothetical protein AB0333_01650 [Citricoccus sp. NPDC079358]
MPDEIFVHEVIGRERTGPPSVVVTQLLVIAPFHLTVFGWCSRRRGSA